jgi:hypothetical protein
MVKAAAAGAVMVAAALPVVAMSGTAGAATPATLTCSAASTGSPSCSSGYAIIGQGFSGNFYVAATGLANDQAIGGSVSLTTTAPGVTFTNVNEDAFGDVTATLTSTSAATPGFYPVTLTDTNGAATLALGLGIDHGPQIATIAGNAGTVGGAASTVTITGTFLNGATPTITGTGTPPSISSWTSPASGTTMSVTVTNNGTAGVYSLHVTAPWPSPANGTTTSTYTENAAATPLTFTSVTPSQLGIPAGPSSSNNLVTVSGTGFEAGATLSLSSPPSGTTLVSSTFVNSTTMTMIVNVTPAAATGLSGITILNPDSTTLTGANMLGTNTPATAFTAGATPPVAPTVNWVSGVLTPGTSSIIKVIGSSTFPMTTGSTVKFSVAGITNATETVSGTVLSVDATNTATVRVIIPRFATSTLTTATTGASTSIVVSDNTGAPSSGTLYIVDGTKTEAVNYTGVSGGNTFTGVVGPLVHAVGVTVEFSFLTGTGILTINNGALTETTAVQVVATSPDAVTFTSAANGVPITSLNPGSYAINAYIAGFGFAAGSTVTFNKDNVTGTVTVVNGNVATLNVVVPSVRTTTVTGVLAAPAVPGQNALSVTSLVNGAGVITVGDKITVNADPFYLTPETFTVTAITGTGPWALSVSTPVTLNHSAGATLSDLSTPQSTTDTIQAVITNGAGQSYVNPSFFSFVATGTATASLNPVGSGASAATENFTLAAATGDTNPLHWVVSSTTPGVTFGAVSAITGAGSLLHTTISVAPGTTPAASVPVKATDGFVTYNGTFAVVAGPTVTGVTTVGTLTAGGTETIGVYGTNFVFPGGMTCSTSDPAVACAIIGQPLTDSATVATVQLTVGAAALNGTDSLTITNTANKGAGTLAGAFKVAGQPAAASISPNAIPQGTAPLLTVTGTGIPSNVNTCAVTATESDGVTIQAPAGFNCSGGLTWVSATSVTISGYGTGWFAGDTLVFTLGNGTSTFQTPIVTVQPHPSLFFAYLGSVISPTHVAQGSKNVPFKFVGSGFLPGTTVSIPAADGALSVTEVTPNAIFGTMNILSTATVGLVLVTALNTSGGSATASLFTIDVAPTVVGTYVGLSGKTTSLVITGTGFYPGAVVTLAVPAMATFGAAVASNGGASCGTGPCTTLTIPVTYVVNAGATPISTAFTVTNPIGGGSVTTGSNGLIVNPGPAVVGTYYVPTFSSHVLVIITGTGFQNLMTATSSNAAYTVGLVGLTNTTATLLVSTTSAATSGTSSTITFTNPDGGTVSFPLNGGPNPALATPPPVAKRVVGHAITGKTTTVHIIGMHFYAQPKIHSNARNTSARVSGDTGTVLTVIVKVAKTTPRGVHTFTIIFANGEQTSIKYNQR